ncbi:MAG: hypothetical protein SFW36_12970 [Leptolyngbyaceae cyanobacterium bins.59]|nr:hypothetical protein [Leptolyngbyaceae cyanobacterium bins.59]
MNTKAIGSGRHSPSLLGQTSFRMWISDRLANFRHSLGSVWSVIVVIDEEGPERW